MKKPKEKSVKKSRKKSPPAATPPVAEQETALVLRCLPENMVSRNYFKWPEAGSVECPDWEPTTECGNGLHGWLWGEGDLDTCDYWKDEHARWLVVEVIAADVVVITQGSGGKCKFQRGFVVFCGARADAVKYLQDRAPPGKCIIFGTATAGNAGTATAGVRGTATAGYRGTATAGDAGTVSIEWWDAKRGVYRKLVGEVDGEALKHNTPYHVVDGKFVEGKAPQ